MKVNNIRFEDGRALRVIEEQRCHTCLCFVDNTCRNHSPVTSADVAWNRAVWPQINYNDWCREYTKHPDQSQEVTK